MQHKHRRRDTVFLLPLLFSLLLAACVSNTAGPSADRFSATYRCENGQKIIAIYTPPDRVSMTTLGTRIDMHIARSADGARYVGRNRVWWTKGSGPGSHGTLFKRGDGDATGAPITTCVQIDTLESV